MQITIGNVAITGAVPEEQVSGFEGTPSQLVQTVQGIGAAAKTFYLRGNGSDDLTGTVARVHASAEACAYFVVQHRLQFPVQGTLTFVTSAGTFTAKNAIAVVTKYIFKGATSVHTYRIYCAWVGTGGSGGGGLGTGGPLTPPGGSLPIVAF